MDIDLKVIRYQALIIHVVFENSNFEIFFSKM